MLNLSLEKLAFIIEKAWETRTTGEADYLIGTPVMADCLEAPIAALDLSIEEFEMSRI